jgi:hypothetical protein
VSAGNAFLHLYLPLLSQETAIMVSTFTYGIKAGVTALALIGINTAAVVTDLAIFFVPIYFLSRPLHAMLVSRFQDRYDTGVRTVNRFGAFWTSAVLGFVMPSVAAMIVVGLLRLGFWKSLGGLFAGSAIYVVLPLLVAEPLASTLPSFLLPLLQWTAPAIVAIYVIIILVRWQIRRWRQKETVASSVEVPDAGADDQS